MSATDILRLINYVLVLIFGLFLSAGISGGWSSVRQKRLIFALCPLFFAVQTLFWKIFGFDTVERLYPLLVHLPLVLILIFALKKSVGVALVSTCTAYLCCQLPNWGRMAVTALSGSALPGEIVYTILIIAVFVLLWRFFVRAAYDAMTYSPLALLIFGSLPVAYYFFDYATTIYSDALYSGVRAINESLPTMIILFYVAFLTAYHVQSQKRADAELQSSLLETALKQSQLEMDSLRRSELQTAVYQHDMRHHLNMIDGLLSAGNPAQAAEYIRCVRQDIEAITPRRYCENETVNLLCSSFSDKAANIGATLNINASLPRELSISDTELCSVLSNGLENALRAVSALPEGERSVSLYCGVKLNKLLIEIRNPCSCDVRFSGGLPVSQHSGQGHGYGCRSIWQIARKNGGLCVFSAKGGSFLLQVMLPVASV